MLAHPHILKTWVNNETILSLSSLSKSTKKFLFEIETKSEISLRGLLNQGPAGQNQQHISGGYNQAPPNFNMTPGQGQRMQQTMQQPHQQQQMQTNHQQQQPMRPLRPPFMQQGPPNQTFPTQPNPNQNNFMNSGPRFQNIRMGTVQATGMQQANMRQPIMQNVSFCFAN